MYIDTHSHIYVEEFAADSDQMLERAKSAGIGTILMPAIDSSTHESMLLMERSAITNCKSMMGVHPCSVNETWREELTVVKTFLEKRKFVAIGEIGLDFHWDLTFKNEQYDAFEQQIEWALEYELPIVIHSRKSTSECIEVIKKYKHRNLKGVFHCFSGSFELAKSIIDQGFYLGIGGVLTFKNAGLAEVLGRLPLDNIILETDAPYLAPMPYRGKRNEPAYIPYVAQKLAEIKDMSVGDVARITTKNAQNLFKL